MSVCTPRNRVLENLIASAWAFARKEAFLAARNACSDYALAAFRHRGDTVLLLLSDELKEIECPHQPDPDHERDLELLAKLRAHPGFAQILSLVLSWHQTAEESRDPIIDPRGHAGEYCGASSLLIQLLRGGV